MKTRILICGLFLTSSAVFSATAPLTESTFTDLVRTVEVLEQPTKNASPARVNEVVKAPDMVRTGASSRAELTAPDQTLTRIGANTVFSFAPSGREINLEQGSVLFHSPTGHGGGTIRSGGASAAVSGTTLIVATTPVANPGDKNGFKVILLEGTGRVTLANGRSRTLEAGQMVFVLPNHTDFGPVLTINLGKLVGGSALVHGFTHELPSIQLIDVAIRKQQTQINKGNLTDTGSPADGFLNNGITPGSGLRAGPSDGDPNIYQIGMSFPPVQNFLNGRTGFSTAPTLIVPPPLKRGTAPAPAPVAGGGVIVTIGGFNGPPLPPPNGVITTVSTPPPPPPIDGGVVVIGIGHPTMPSIPPIFPGTPGGAGITAPPLLPHR